MFDNLKKEIRLYKTYKENKDVIKDYLFKTSYGSECDSCLDFTTLLEQELYHGVCEDCYSSGTLVCSRCGKTVYATEMDINMVCNNCIYHDDFTEYYDSGNTYPNSLDFNFTNDK